MKPLRTMRRHLAMCLAVVLLLSLATGCQTVKDHSLTGKLWEEDSWSQHNEAASTSNLKLFRSVQGNDVLVQYDEWREKNEAVRRRAFFLKENLSRLEAGRRPRFVNPQPAAEMQAIAVFTKATVITPPAPPLYAIVSTNGQQFTLYEQGLPKGPYSLPAYRESSGHVQHVLLTPLALAGDALVLGIFCGALWLDAGAPGVDHH